MPTHNRRAFVPRAVKYFLRQYYLNKELIIVDDSTDSIADLVPANERIRYLRLDERLSIGAKRNRACELAQGEIIVHWDDDDWMADWRMSYQVAALLERDVEVCGLSNLFFYEPASGQAWQYIYPPQGRFWVAGATLCYRRSFWQRHPFPNLNVGEDARFLWSAPSQRMLALARQDFYVAINHRGNTSPRRTRDARYHPWAAAELQRMMGEDWNFYAELAQREAPKPIVPAAPTRSEPLIKQEAMMKINLGCCDAPLAGFVNVDIAPGPGVEVVDLREPWPWPDSSVELVRAWDIIEHLPDKIFTMNELWRVLKRGGRAEIAVPTTDGSGAWQDPTHVSFWNRRSFLYYEDGNPYRERFANFYGIKARFRIAAEHTERTADGPRLTIVLEAVKESAAPAAVQQRADHHDTTAPVAEATDFSVVVLSARAANLIPCVQSVLACEPELAPERIIIVDDGARGEAEAQLPGVRWVTGSKPFIFARNANLGLRAAPGDVILLNDDARLLTRQGFTRLVQCARTQPHAGVCSAGISGIVGNPDQLATGRSEFRVEARTLAFICVYLPRTTLDRIGLLDERFVGYGFDDNDYCVRVQRAGLQLGIWDGCVVDHSGELPSTFRTRPELPHLLRQNQKLFQEKWGGRHAR